LKQKLKSIELHDVESSVNRLNVPLNIIFEKTNMIADTEKLFANAGIEYKSTNNVAQVVGGINRPSLKTIKLVVAGGRDFENAALLCLELYNTYTFKGIEVEVVCGLARGADSMGKEWAIANGAKVHEFPADWDKFGKSAGYKRNKQMGEFADEVLVFWDGVSKGTKHMIDLAKLLGKPLKVVMY
jgi:hypothetical protein